ncbi:type II secretion system minor pseudopilin GspK [uncultured Sphingomonas sp.]|uniref:type II secretion system minor pseudopilin GspK n=1 Tax=uncultured Sphingomonas sp. TaxID=158754 RepID=UPI0035CBFA69
MRRPEHGPNAERGAALLTVLMLVAIIAVLAGGALERLRITTRLAGNAIGGEQARAYAYAAEALALSRVTDQLARDRTRVSLAGGWSGRPFGLPLPGGGYAVARVTDGGNCFNLNGLVLPGNQPGSYSSNGAGRVVFVRLMRLIDVPVQAAETIAASASDWIDTDQDQQPAGGEDELYRGREVPYRTANTLMSDPSELRAVNGMTPEIYARLRPWVCALPKAEMSTINVNTLAPEQAPLVAMLMPETLTVQAARGALLRRPPQGYKDAATFWNQITLADGAGSDQGSGQTGVTSTWFALRVDVTMGDTVIEEHALIDANRLPARLAARQWGEDS